MMVESPIAGCAHQDIMVATVARIHYLVYLYRVWFVKKKLDVVNCGTERAVQLI